MILFVFSFLLFRGLYSYSPFINHCLCHVHLSSYVSSQGIFSVHFVFNFVHTLV